MAKNFKGGLDSVLGEASGNGQTSKSKDIKQGRPKTNFKAIEKSSQIGTKEHETRATFIVNEEQLEYVKALAYWERLSIKDLLSQALAAFIASKKKDLPKALESYKSKRTV